MSARVGPVQLARAAAITALSMLAACGGGTASSPDPATPPAGGSASSGVAPIFDPTLLHDARLELDPSAWQALRDNFMSNQYYAANLTIDGVAVASVGIRSRGSGSRSEEKPALKVDFNKYVPGQEYYGYKSLVIRNMVQDPSMLRERLAFLVFEAMGIEAPHNSFARLSVNGEYWGLFSLVEPVSKPFLKSRLGEESGALFDYTWAFPYSFDWLGDDASAYVPLPFQPETNEDHPDVADGLVAFVEAINYLPEAGFSAAIGAQLDVDRFLTHIAVENAIAEHDGITGDDGLNNFYLYEYGQKNRFVFIPWDKDSAFTEGSWPLYRNLDKNLLSARLTAEPALRQRYSDLVARAVTSYVNPRWLTPQLETAYQQIRAAALADPHKPYSSAAFEDGVSGLRGVIAAREADVAAQR